MAGHAFSQRRRDPSHDRTHLVVGVRRGHHEVAVWVLHPGRAWVAVDDGEVRVASQCRHESLLGGVVLLREEEDY